MTIKVNVSIHVQVENGEGETIKMSISTEQFEQGFQQIIRKSSQVLGQKVLEGYESQLKAGEYREGVSIRTQKRCYQFQDFSINYRRRSYRMPGGSVQTPLDAILGFTKYQRRSCQAQEQIGAIAASVSYRKTAQINRYICQESISASTVCRVVRELGQRLEAQEAQFEADEPGKVKSSILYCESDGISISLQKAAKRRAEVRVAIGYTGKRFISKSRKRLINKTCLMCIGKDTGAWQARIREKFYASYDLEQVKAICIGGDGGPWVGSSFDLLGIQNTTRILDPFHVKRSIRQAFGAVLDTKQLIAKLYAQGFQAVEKTLLDRVLGGTKAQIKSRLDCLQYLRNHADEITPTAVSLGAIEANVGKLIGQRMKTRGVSWSIAGAQGMLMLLMHQEELLEHCFQYQALKAKRKVTPRKASKTEPGAVHLASFPVLKKGKISAPYASLFKAIIHDDLPLSS